MLDTAEKRRAAAGLHLFALPTVTPNISKDAEWRRQVVGTLSLSSVVTYSALANVILNNILGNGVGSFLFVPVPVSPTTSNNSPEQLIWML